MKKQVTIFSRRARGFALASALTALAFSGQACAPDINQKSESPAAAERPPAPGTPGATAAAVAGSATDLDGDGPGAELPPLVQKARQFAILLREGARDFHLARRLIDADFLMRHGELSAEGFYLADFEIVSEGTPTLFSGLWHRGAVEQRLDLTGSRQSFLAADVAAAEAGLYPADVETYRLGGERQFAGLWSGNAPANRLRVGTTRERIEREVQDGTLGIVDLESWPTNSGRRYLVVHRPPSAHAPRVFLGQTLGELESEIDKQENAGYAPVELEIDDIGGAARYSTYWQQPTVPFSTWSSIFTSEALQDCRLVSLGLESPAFEPSPDRDRCLALRRQLPGEVDSHEAPETGRVAPIEGPQGSPGPVADLTSQAPVLKEVPFGFAAVHIIDFVVTRRELIDPSVPLGAVSHHQGVFHDSGSSGPGSL